MDRKEESCSDSETSSSEFEEEQWAQIPGYSKYSASTLGRIKLQNGRISEGRITPSGYRMITICDDGGISKCRYLHRLIALTWIPNPENKPYVDHLDRCKHNAKASNLRWCTAAENMQNRDPVVRHKLTNQYTHNNVLMKEWSSIGSITEELGYSHQEITTACKENSLLGKCYWKFVDDIPIEGEVWKNLEINGCEIKVSSFGRILRSSGKFTYGYEKPNGYMCVHINRKTFYVHRLVLMAHCPIKNPELYQVNHLNFVIGYRGNFLANLEWCTRSENVNHSIINRNKTKTMKPVCQYSYKGKFIQRFDTMREAYRSLGDKSCESVLASCETKKRYGQHFWRYASDNLKEIENTRKEGCVPVNKFSLDGKFIRRYNSIMDASEDLGRNSFGRGIVRVCRGGCITAYGYIWRYADKENKDIIPDDVEPRDPVKIKLAIRQYDSTGQFIREFATMKAAYLFFKDEDGTGLYKACRNKPTKYREFYWRYSSEDLDSIDPPVRKNAIAVDMLDLKGNFIRKFKSIALAAKSIGDIKYASGIVMVCKGINRTSYGYKWRYSDIERDDLKEEENSESKGKDLNEENLTDLEEVGEEDLDQLYEDDLEYSDDEENNFDNQTTEEEKTPTQKENLDKSSNQKEKFSSHKKLLKQSMTKKQKKLVVDGVVVGIIKPKFT